MKVCARCGKPHASFGFGPPTRQNTDWFCGDCRDFQPERQRDLALQAREAIDDPGIIIF